MTTLRHLCRSVGRYGSCRGVIRYYSTVENNVGLTDNIKGSEDVGKPYDIVICGGGMVGHSMLASLASKDQFSRLKVCLLESASDTAFASKETYSNRVCALSNGTRTFLEEIGAWRTIEEHRYGPVKRMQVWDACSDSTIAFSSSDYITDVAYIVENDLIFHAIKTATPADMENFQTKYSSSVKSVKLPQKSSSLSEVTLQDGDTLQTRLLIGADGAQSGVRRAAGITAHTHDYQQMGLVATLHVSEECENNVAWQRFLPSGPIALLPLSPTRSSLVWSTSPSHARNLLKLSAEDFIDAVNAAFWSEKDRDGFATYAGQVLDNILVSTGFEGSQAVQLPPAIEGADAGSRAAFPLGLMHASQYVQRGLALVGDAAHRVHPMAGQGVNLGFGDVRCLRDCLLKAVSEGAHLGSLRHLLDYERERQRHVIPVMSTIHGLQKLYNTTLSPVVTLRTLGLQATNACEPLKRVFLDGAAR